MTASKIIYSTGLKLSSIVMLLLLVWLTVCLPVVYAHQQAQAQQAIVQHQVPEDGNSNPLSNTTEEKAGNGLNTLSEEYLHHAHHSDYMGMVVKTYYKCHATSLYFAFHPELISPPPNNTLS